MTLDPLDSSSLMVPMNAVAVDLKGQVRTLAAGPGGDLAHRMLAQRTEPVDYEVLVSGATLIAAHSGQDEAPRGGTSAEAADSSAADSPAADALNADAASPRVRELGRQIMGEGSAAERAAKLERWLNDEISYTTDFAGREGRRPIEEFLFDHRSGHCELFATSMVLMLRAEGIPARLVSGFLGAEVNNLEDQLVVRQSNAHAWVEAETEAGWRVFDPTPPIGRPSSPSQGLALLAQQIYDYVVYRFDRYVLTYGSDDQKSYFETIKAWVAAQWHRFWPDEPDADLADSAVPLSTVVPGQPTEGFALWTSQKVRLGGLLIFALLVTALWLWSRRSLSIEDAYSRLRSSLEELGFGVDNTTAPLDLRRRLTTEVPAAADPGGRLVDLYVDISYGENDLAGDARKQLRSLLAATLHEMARVAKERRTLAKQAERANRQRTRS
jgi:hypothetical protein